MEINHSERFQTSLGKNYSLTWTDYYSNFRFYSGHQYVARNYAFKIISERGEVVRFTVAIDELGMVALERMCQRKVTPGERSDMAKQQIMVALNGGSGLRKNNLAEVQSDLLARTAENLGIK